MFKTCTSFIVAVMARGDEVQCYFASITTEKVFDAFISGVPEPSTLQDDVISQLSSMGLELEEEVLIKSGYRLDALVEVNGKEVGVEVDGPFPFHWSKPKWKYNLKHRQVTTLDGSSRQNVQLSSAGGVNAYNTRIE